MKMLSVSLNGEKAIPHLWFCFFHFLRLILLKRQPCQLLRWERHYLSEQFLLLNTETLYANENNADDFQTIISYYILAVQYL
jgi:hypothetical protein